MTDVRFNPKSGPRSTGIERTKLVNNQPVVSGQSITTSAGVAPGVTAHAQASQAKRSGGPAQIAPSNAALAAAMTQPPGSIALTDDQLYFLGQLVYGANQSMLAALQSVPNDHPDAQKNAEILVAQDTAAAILKVIGAELDKRPAFAQAKAAPAPAPTARSEAATPPNGAPIVTPPTAPKIG